VVDPTAEWELGKAVNASGAAWSRILAEGLELVADCLLMILLPLFNSSQLLHILNDHIGEIECGLN
jgi:hypothetical protein